MKKEITMSFGQRLKELRLENDYSGEILCNIYNLKFDASLNKGTLSKYENRLQEPSFTTVKNLADMFNVRIEYLIGKDDNRSYINDVECKIAVPILQFTAAGSPPVVIESTRGFELISDDTIDYCFSVMGNSMIGTRIYDGDLVYIDNHSPIYNGDIVLVIQEDEGAILKKYFKYGSTIILRTESPDINEKEFISYSLPFTLFGKVKSVKFNI
jgi:repressor LexA